MQDITLGVALGSATQIAMFVVRIVIHIELNNFNQYFSFLTNMSIQLISFI